MKIGLAQMNTGSVKEDNLVAAEVLVNSLAEQGIRLVVLPEYFNFIGPENQWMKNAEKLDNSPSLERMRIAAKKQRVYLHLGSMMERKGENIYNTSVVFNPEGEIIAQYRKIHLFDVDVPGGRRYLESDVITPGESTSTFTIDDITFGMATCYDLRFPELFRELSSEGAQVFLLPAAFTLMTGKDHWELLIRARAVENQCWVAAVDQFGSCPPNHMSFGRSMIVDPWGVIVAQAPDRTTTIAAEIDLQSLLQLRNTFPVLQHVRKDLFC